MESRPISRLNQWLNGLTLKQIRHNICTGRLISPQSRPNLAPISPQSRRRCALDSPSPPEVVVTDSQQYAHGAAFLDALNARRPAGHAPIAWRRETVRDFTGSSLLVDEDVTYDAEVRYLSLRGWVAV